MDEFLCRGLLTFLSIYPIKYSGIPRWWWTAVAAQTSHNDGKLIPIIFSAVSSNHKWNVDLYKYGKIDK